MRAIGIAIGVPFSRVPGGFTPLSLTPALWLDASDAATVFEDDSLTTLAVLGTDVVGGWTDKSGNGRHFTNTGTSRPSYVDEAPLGGKGCLYFDGVDDTLVKASDAGFPTGDFTLISVSIASRATAYADGEFGVVFHYGSAASGQSVIAMFGTSISTGWADGYGISQYGDSAGTSGERGTWKSYGNRRTGTTYETLVNGGPFSSDTMTAATTTGSSSVGIGAYAASALFLEGYIAEIILIPRAITAGELAALQSYLVAKWGI